jgi:hypothetical protein
MRLVAARDEEHVLVAIQTIAMHLNGGAVQRHWNVYRTDGASGSAFPVDFLVQLNDAPTSITLDEVQEARVARTARRSVPYVRPEQVALFLAFARAIEADRRSCFVRDRKVLARYSRPSMRVLARYRDWPELDLPEEEMPSRSTRSRAGRPSRGKRLAAHLALRGKRRRGELDPARLNLAA